MNEQEFKADIRRQDIAKERVLIKRDLRKFNIPFDPNESTDTLRTRLRLGLK